MSEPEEAPGRPGIEPHWTSSAKIGVGTATGSASAVWFTLGNGVLNEIYWPEVDSPCTRELAFIVSDGAGFVSDERDRTSHKVEYLAPGVPAFRLTNECKEGRYRLEKEILADPQLDVVLVRTRFHVRDDSDLKLHVLLAPHLRISGRDNTAWIDTLWGQKILLAQRDGNALALACSVPFLKCSAGYVGVSDGWRDFQQHNDMTWTYPRARCGNVGLTAEIDWKKCDGTFTLALGFGYDPVGAAHHARASLLDGFSSARREYIRQWQDWQKPLQQLADKKRDNGLDYYRISTAVLHSQQAKKYPGGIVASLSIPWGYARGDQDRGGYHIVWVRDLVQVTGGLLAAGCALGAAKILRFLSVTQEADGSWPQNMWVNGTCYSEGRQMDESAFPILLVATALRERLIDREELERLWPMVRKALGFIVQHGPVTEQDRWEELGGFSPYTIAVEIAALVEAAEFSLEPELCDYLRETADIWNDSIERWTYARHTELALRYDVDGYYVRITPESAEGYPALNGKVNVANTAPPAAMVAYDMIATDALALVRYGLRAANNPRILNTIKVIDSLLKVETPNGPAWRRYNTDRYGEHADGSAFDGTGTGRAWPLLTGERAHYELTAGRKEEAQRLLKAMEAFSSEGGMIPEQVWDTHDIPERGLYCGRPSGSGMPLAWAHAEYIKLLRSLRDGRVFDTPPATQERYIERKVRASFVSWRFCDRIKSIPLDKDLRIEVLAPAIVRWSIDGWESSRDDEATDTHLGVYFVDMSRAKLPASGSLVFTFFWLGAQRWEGHNFEVAL